MTFIVETKRFGEWAPAWAVDAPSRKAAEQMTARHNEYDRWRVVTVKSASGRDFMRTARLIQDHNTRKETRA